MALFNLNNPYERDRFKEYINGLYKEQACVEVKKKHTKRTLAQNSYLHVLLGYFASEFGFTLEEVKFELFKKQCNHDIFARKRTNKRGYEVEYLRSSRDLDTLEMTTAIERFRNYSSAECGLYLPAPHESESLFFAQQQIEKFKEYL